MTERRIDTDVLPQLWMAGVKLAAIAARFGVTEAHVSTTARKMGLPDRRMKEWLRRADAAPAAVPAPARVTPAEVSGILQTGGKYRALCEYAAAYGLSHTQALALWHRERVAA